MHLSTSLKEDIVRWLVSITLLSYSSSCVKMYFIYFCLIYLFPSVPIYPPFPSLPTSDFLLLSFPISFFLPSLSFHSLPCLYLFPYSFNVFFLLFLSMCLFPSLPTNLFLLPSVPTYLSFAVTVYFYHSPSLTYLPLPISFLLFIFILLSLPSILTFPTSTSSYHFPSLPRVPFPFFVLRPCSSTSTFCFRWHVPFPSFLHFLSLSSSVSHISRSPSFLPSSSPSFLQFYPHQSRPILPPPSPHLSFPTTSPFLSFPPRGFYSPHISLVICLPFLSPSPYAHVILALSSLPLFTLTPNL